MAVKKKKVELHETAEQEIPPMPKQPDNPSSIRDPNTGQIIPLNFNKPTTPITPEIPTKPDKVQTATKFNPDGTVTLTAADGTATTLTKDKYNEFLKGRRGAGGLSPELTELSKKYTPLEYERVKQQQYAEAWAPFFQSLGTPTPEQQAAAGQGAQMGNVYTGILPELGAGILQGAVAGGATGATAGLMGAGATAGLSIPALAAAGAVTGGVYQAFNIVGKLKSESTLERKTQYKSFSESQQNMKAIIDYVNKGGDPIDAINLFKNEIAKINAAEINFKNMSEADWLYNAKPQLIEIQSFNDGMKQSLMQQLQLAILKPNPNQQYSYTQTGEEEENE